MTTEFKLPDLGENIESGDIVSILVQPGDVVAANQPVVEVETGKATVELPCPVAGKVLTVHVQKGQSVPVGGVILTLDAVAVAPSKPAPKAPSVPAPAPPVPAASAPPPASPPAPRPLAPTPAPEPVSVAGPAKSGSAAIAAGPAMRRFARELGVDLAQIKGTAPGGRITREDIIAAVRQSASAPKPAVRKPMGEGVDDRDAYGPVRRQALSRIRKTIAANMAHSSATIPHVTNFDDADITEIERIRKDGLVKGAKLTMLAFVLKAVAQALQLHPTLNASIDLEGGEVVYKNYINLGIAVDTERGLVVPVLRGVDQLSIPAIAQAVADIAERARLNQFGLEDLRGGTFTISNLGAIGGVYSTPIINPPEVAILLVGRSRQLPVVVDDKIEPRLMMPLSLSYDHRLVDGAAAARFLNEVKELLQTPGRLLLAS